MEFIYELEDIASVAEIVVAQNPKKVILFYGEMGAGKLLLSNNCVKRRYRATSSPTFSLVNEYKLLTMKQFTILIFTD
jgi:tRNA threonylcarbamoyladenosine biosynthesis protein TsaE